MNNREKKNGSVLLNNPLVRAIGTQNIVVVLVLTVLYSVFCILSVPFRSYTTLITIFSYSYYIAFMAIGVTFVIIAGGIDLSIGARMIFCAVLGGYCVVELGMSVVVGMIVTILSGIIFGALNGFLVACIKIPPFIATLSTMMVCRGLGSIITKGMSVTWPIKGSEQGWFRDIFRIQLGGINFPLGLVWVLLSVVLMTLVLNKSKLGRYIIAIGSNSEAARLSGVSVTKYHVAAYAICGFFTGLAGIAYAACFQGVVPATGPGLELDAIGSVVIGGTSMAGGSGSVVSTLLGVFVMSLLKTGLPFVGLQANWQQLITGAILIGAVSFDIIKNKRMLRIR